MYQKYYYVYILTNRANTVLYIGVTSNLRRRIWEHQQKKVPGFTQKYNLIKLIYYEQYTHIYDAIIREKRLKKWKRTWKEKLIKTTNPDLSELLI